MLPLSVTEPISCWVVTDGKAGMQSQCVGLAEALRVTPVIKRVALRGPWKYFAPHFRVANRWAYDPVSNSLEPPWPDLLIATGRQSVPASLFVRAQSLKDRPARPTITVQIQNPLISPRRFDLVVAPRHDRLAGTNVVSTYGAMHRINASALMEGAAQLAPIIGAMPRPYIGVLLGGANAAYRMTPAEMTPLAERLRGLARNMRGSLFITPSRRTGAENVAALRAQLHDIPYFLWNGQGANPYFGILALANFLIVTPDSVNMVSEAVATGKPVYVADLPGGSRKFERFHQTMVEAGFVRPLAGPLTTYSYTPPDDVDLVVARVQSLLAGRKTDA